MKMSLKERDRRYKLIRQGMEEQGIDVIVAGSGAGGSGGRLAANFRYLTNLDSQGTYVIFPREGTTVVIMGDRFPAEAMKGQDLGRIRDAADAQLRDCSRRGAQEERPGQRNYRPLRI